jgi:hypothetical protein
MIDAFAPEGLRNLTAILEAIDLAKRETSDTDERVKPPAVQRAVSALADVFASLQEAIPPASVSADGDGGLEIYWTAEGYHVQLNIPGA